MLRNPTSWINFEPNFDELVESWNFYFSAIPANLGSGTERAPEFGEFNEFWMPDQVRHDGFEAFYGTVNFYLNFHL
jgi:hypothetical protein